MLIIHHTSYEKRLYVTASHDLCTIMEPAPNESAENGEQYGSFTTGDGDVVVYDTENPEAWLQSSYAVEVGPSSERTSA